MLFLPLICQGQEVLLAPDTAAVVLSLEECRSKAVEASRDLAQAKIGMQLADFDRKIALANFFPSISASGSYMWNQKPLRMISDERYDALSNLGTNTQGRINDWTAEVQSAIEARPDLFAEYIASPLWQEFINRTSDLGIAEPIDRIGQSIADEFVMDIRNVYVGMVTLVQPVFMGGKIILANQAAKLAGDLASEQYAMKYAEVITDVDQAYWQIVSIALKKRLAEAYAELVHSIGNDVSIAKDAGVATASDALQVKVKEGEADMMVRKAANGLALAKMLLCKRVGLPLDTEIELEEEKLLMEASGLDGASLIASGAPAAPEQKNIEDIYDDRPETRSLELATGIYDRKAGMARADMMPQIAATAGYMVSNPNMYHGFQKKFDGSFFAGVTVQVPIFHGFEALQKYRKAKAEASLYREQLSDAREMIALQVEQSRRIYSEARDKLSICDSYLESAGENLRVATVGFEAGGVSAQTLLQAQTAWLQASTESIDAAVALRMAHSELLRAEGELRPANK